MSLTVYIIVFIGKMKQKKEICVVSIGQNEWFLLVEQKKRNILFLLVKTKQKKNCMVSIVEH